MKVSSFVGAVFVFTSACAAQAPSVEKPQELVWEASAAEIEALLEGKCARGFVNRPIDPPFLPNVENKQVQIDCDGLEYFGAPRWTEFVIADDRLQMAWVMVEAGDKDAIVAAMKAAYGEPSAMNESFIAFEGARTAWRNEPPEVLFYSPSLAPVVENFFAENSE